MVSSGQDLLELEFTFPIDHNTIFFMDIMELSKQKRSQLLTTILDTNLNRRNRLIFSVTTPFDQGVNKDILEFVDLLSCVTIHLPTLREHASEITMLSSLYLNMLNISLENQVIGIEPSGIELLKKYSWPYNYTQFKRVMNELSLACTTPYITRESVEERLKEEQKPIGNAYTVRNTDEQGNDYHLDLTRTLNEINQDIVRIVLEENGGNQTKAAKQLGIGRSTLWRYLK